MWQWWRIFRMTSPFFLMLSGLYVNSTDDGVESSLFEKVWGQYTTVPLFLLLVLYPLVNFKSATFFTKFNSLGRHGISSCWLLDTCVFSFQRSSYFSKMSDFHKTAGAQIWIVDFFLTHFKNLFLDIFKPKFYFLIYKNGDCSLIILQKIENTVLKKWPKRGLNSPKTFMRYKFSSRGPRQRDFLSIARGPLK